MDRLPIEFHNASGEITAARYSRAVIRLLVKLPDQPAMECVAAIDTGAGRSFIKKSLVSAGTMPAELNVPVVTAEGRKTDTFAFKAILGSQFTNQLLGVNLVALDFQHNSFDMLLGIDFLVHGVLMLDYADQAASHFSLHEPLDRAEKIMGQG